MYCNVIYTVVYCDFPTGEVIPGWEVGLASMQRTELARFLIRPEYAFGEMGCPPRIPPNATSELLELRFAVRQSGLTHAYAVE